MIQRICHYTPIRLAVVNNQRTEAGEYLPHMYGAVNYVVIDEVTKLPLKVSDIHRKLTT